jgi:hypothetical protein
MPVISVLSKFSVVTSELTLCRAGTDAAVLQPALSVNDYVMAAKSVAFTCIPPNANYFKRRCIC